jgi:uncharacterized Zn finger protein (UPF0148 family)
MTEVHCPSCQTPMGIEENEPTTEWECPACAAAFVTKKASEGALQLVVTEKPPQAQAGAIETEAAHNKRNSTRRRRRNVRLEASADHGDRGLDITRNGAPANPLQDRFPDMQPTDGVPPLWTINGIGFSFYGARDFDEATGSYVKSACLCVFFVPIFVTGSYRVIDGQQGGWHVLGKVPLSSLAKGWNWMMLAFIGFIVLLIMFR